MMFCPRCGTKNSTEQKFCRSCGMNLADVTFSYLQQFPDSAATSIQKQERRLERFGGIVFGGFGLVILTAIGAIIYWIVTKMILTGENIWSGILLVAFMVFAGLLLTYVVLRESINDKKQKLNIQLASTELKRPFAAAELGPGRSEPAISVVEDTTELLPIESKTRKLP